MFHDLFNWFVKLTAWPMERVTFGTRVYYEDKKIQNRHIRGSAIVVCNHTSVYDYAVLLFTFWTRTLRVFMAELLFDKKVLGPFLKLMGGIYVDRNARDFGSVIKAEKILEHGGVVGIFPEGRLPLPDEVRPLEFKTGAAYLALESGEKVIPVFTDGRYFADRPASVIIGAPMDLRMLTEGITSEKERIEAANSLLREKIIGLERMLNEQKQG